MANHDLIFVSCIVRVVNTHYTRNTETGEGLKKKYVIVVFVPIKKNIKAAAECPARQQNVLHATLYIRS